MDALHALAAKDDIESLKMILAELRNPIAEMRGVALAATKEAGNREAIPWLERAALEAQDTNEAKAIDAVIDYLKLPTAIEELGTDP